LRAVCHDQGESDPKKQSDYCHAEECEQGERFHFISPLGWTRGGGDFARAVHHFRRAAERTASIPERDYLMGKALTAARALES
jgi:hypothetical protein